MITVLKISVSGDVTQDRVGTTLQALQALVGGMLEPVRLVDRLTLWVNEEGVLLDLPPNRVLTDVFGPWLGTVICGPGFLSGEDEEGELVSLTEDQILAWRTRLLSGAPYRPKGSSRR